MQEPHLPVLSGKLIPLMGGGIVPRTKTCVNWGGPIAMLPHFHQGKAYTKMNLQVWKVQKCIPLVGAETQLTCVDQQTTPSHGGGIWPRMETWVNWGGPIAMVPCLHQRYIYIQRKLRLSREQKCIALVSGGTPLPCAGRQTTPSHGG